MNFSNWRRGGDLVVPLLLEALRDPNVLFLRYGKDFLDGSALETALDLLEPFGLPEVGVLEPALRHREEFFRYRSLYHLAQCGNDDAIDVLKSGLISDSEDCRTWTLMGLEFLRDSPRGSKEFRASLFKAVLPMLVGEEDDPAEHVPSALLALDFEKAQSVCLGAKVFRPENKNLHLVMRALKDGDVPVPGGKLLPLLAGIKKYAASYPHDYAYGHGLILLARAEGARALAVIRDALSWGNDTVRGKAAEAEMIAAGATGAFEFVIDIHERKGLSGLTKPQLYYLTLTWLDGDVTNGGFAQYYFNSSGDLARYAVEAAQAIGAAQLAVIIENANALFGKNGPDSDREKRMGRLSKIDFADLEELDMQYYNCAQKLSEMLPRYVASNASSFKPKG